MNKDLIQINDHYAAVSDTEGNIRVVSKNDNSQSFEEILTLENELEKKEGQLAKDKEQLSINKYEIIGGEITNLVIYGGIAATYFITRDKLTPTGQILLPLTLYIPFKGLNYTTNGGTRFKKLKTRKLLKEEIGKLEESIPQLRKKYEEITTRSQFDGKVTAVEPNAPYKQIVRAMDDLRDKREFANPRVKRLLMNNR